jgi:N-acyl-phosphatidylethanolamine-hydrolysing phospholipase D
VPSRHAKLVSVLLLAAMCGLACSSQALAVDSGPRLGPAPRDESGRFRNFADPLDLAGPSVTLPFFARRVLGRFRELPEGLPEQEPDAASRLQSQAAEFEATVTWVNHASLLVRMDGVTILTDPTWADAAGPGGFLGARRWAQPGLALDDLPPIDLVLISHNHYDSFDLDALLALADRNTNTRFLVPLGDAETLRDEGIERVEEFDWSETLSLGDVTVHCLPSQHWSRRGLFDAKKSLWASWAVIGPSRRFYFAGDSGYFPGFAWIGEALGPFDLAAVPIGAYEPVRMMRPFHMDPEQAVQTALDVEAARAVAMHFGTFDLTDEPVDEPPQRFRAAAEASALGAERAWVLRLGETRPF